MHSNKKATFPGREIKLRTWLFIFIPGIIAIILITLYGTYLAMTAYPQYGPALAIMRARTWYIVAAGILILIAPYFLYCLLARLHEIEVDGEGITIRDGLFHRQTYCWTEISGITASSEEVTFMGRVLRTFPTGTIYLSSGKWIHLTNRFQRLPDLIKLIKHKIYPSLWQSTKSNFKSGQEIKFGSIGLDHKGIIIPERKIEWSAIRSIRILSGNLVVELRDNFTYQVQLESIQNLELLFKVIDWGISI